MGALRTVGTWGLEGRCQAHCLPPYPVPHLVDHPINLHRDDEVGVVHWLWGGKRSCWGGALRDHPPRPGQVPSETLASALASCPHLEGAVHQGLVQVDDHADLVRVLGLGLGEQVLDWSLLRGWAALAVGTSLKTQSFLPHGSSLPPALYMGRLWDDGDRPSPSQLCPCQLWGLGLAAWLCASLHHLEKRLR